MKELEKDNLLEELVRHQHLYNVMMVKFQELLNNQKDIDPEIAQVVNENWWSLLNK
jgi:hypothetical protein